MDVLLWADWMAQSPYSKCFIGCAGAIFLVPRAAIVQTPILREETVSLPSQPETDDDCGKQKGKSADTRCGNIHSEMIPL
jgi:hypothetical protein